MKRQMSTYKLTIREKEKENRTTFIFSIHTNIILPLVHLLELATDRGWKRKSRIDYEGD